MSGDCSRKKNSQVHSMFLRRQKNDKYIIFMGYVWLDLDLGSVGLG